MNLLSELVTRYRQEAAKMEKIILVSGDGSKATAYIRPQVMCAQLVSIEGRVFRRGMMDNGVACFHEIPVIPATYRVPEPEKQQP